jgi:hypothetical protein
MSHFPHRRLPRFLLTVLVIAAGLVGCGIKETGEAVSGPGPSLMLSSTIQPFITQTTTPTVTPTNSPTPTPTLFVPAQLFDESLDIWAGPVDVPLQLQIPALKVDAPVLGVGLTAWNVMDAPISSAGSPFWHSAFWFRGSSIPGEVGTATIAGHITDPHGKPGTFRYISDLKIGDLIIVHDNRTSIDILFTVNEVKTITPKESSDPAVLTLIYGAGPVAGYGPQPSLDGLAHLTLITCATNSVTLQFDDRTVVLATRTK